MNQMPKVSVCVLTYNPKKDQLIETLKSIVEQTYENLQIVLSDDGSQNAYFDEAKAFLDGAGFTDCRLVLSSENQGTVRNMEQALLASDGEYIKAISPGDCLARKTILEDWVAHLLRSGRHWSFSDAIYYTTGEDGTRRVCKQAALPQRVNCYLQRDDDQCRWNYVVLADLPLGATIFGERNLMLRYIRRIVGRIKYAEDYIYRIMMLHGVLPDYFPEETVLYEYGTGISTGKSRVWAKRLKEDWKATNRIILEEESTGDKLQQKMLLAVKRQMNRSRILRNLEWYTEKGRVGIMLQWQFHPRMTGGNEGEQLCR